MNMTDKVITLVNKYRNGEILTKSEFKLIIEVAKEAYYNTGKPIIEDFEYDDIESRAGLENKTKIGTKHNPSHTVKHPYMMGSLSKIQIKKVKDTNYVDFSSYIPKLFKFIGNNDVIITPKFDGCSFEIQTSDGSHITDISTRGDGEYGKDIKQHIISQAQDAIANVPNINGNICYRGEVLIKKSVFEQKYSDFVNPRSFVSGVLNRKFDGATPEEVKELTEMCKDLSIIIYDVRIFNGQEWLDYDWNEINGIHAAYVPDFYIPKTLIRNSVDFENIYNEFSEYRTVCPFALDGIVIKPVAGTRIPNTTEERPKDCVAIKFVPMLEETEVEKIEWKVGKSGEVTPVIITKPVIMDGKEVKRAKAHNYGYLIDNKLSVGSKVILSLAGDIIPFIYRITNTDAYDENKLEIPTDIETYVDGCHLMAVLNDTDKARIDFINSVEVLKIDYMGPANAAKLFEYLKPTNDETSDFFGESFTTKAPNNVLCVTPNDVYYGVGGSKTGQNCRKAFNEVISTLTLSRIIQSCNIRFCGEEVANQCANYLMGLPYDFTHLASKGYTWCFDENNCGEDGPSENLQKVLNVLAALGKTFEDFKEVAKEVLDNTSDDSDRIPVILTGDPSQYSSKADFRKSHPEYREVKTTKAGWNECKILFTNSLSSTTNKMKEAMKRGIEIRVY